MSPAKRPHCQFAAYPIYHPAPPSRVRTIPAFLYLSASSRCNTEKPRGKRSIFASPTHASRRLSRTVADHPSNFPLGGTLSSSVRDTAGRPVTCFSTCTLHSHRCRAVDDHHDRYAQRPRVCICLGVGSLNSNLVRKPTSRSLARFFTHCLFLFPSPLFSCGIYKLLSWLCRLIGYPTCGPPEDNVEDLSRVV